MSRKTTQFKKKAKQLRSKNANAELIALIPTSRVKGTGRTTIYISQDGTGEDGKPVKAGKRIPGRASNAIVTEPMDSEKAQKLIRSVK